MSTVRQARAAFFHEENLPADGGYRDEWFDAAFGPVRYRIRNFGLRADALFRHDIHHALTGYRTDWLGEVQVNAWELGAGIGNQAWAWVIMLVGVFLGALLAPAESLAAFARGRRSRNLYAGELPDDLLERDLDELARELGVTGPMEPTLTDAAHFVAVALGSTLVTVALLPGLLLLIGHSSLARLYATLEACSSARCLQPRPCSAAAMA
jgi:hypothetical protein